jgi:hypothetical protein
MNGYNNGIKALKDNSQDTNASDSNSTTDTSKRYRFESFIE